MQMFNPSRYILAYGNKFIKFHDYAKPLDEGCNEVLDKQSVFMIGTKIITELSNKEKRIPSRG